MTMLIKRAFLLVLVVELSEAAGLKNEQICNGVVGFSASGANKVQGSGLLSFKTDIFNGGQGWSREPGAFTVLCPGVYFISFTGCLSPDTRLVLKKRAATASSPFQPVISTPPGGGTNNVIIQLFKDEQLAVFVSKINGPGVGTLRTDVEQADPVMSFTAHRIN